VSALAPLPPPPPPGLEAREPAEARGLARDEVRLLVARRGDGLIVHARFRDLPCHLRAGDLLVVNTSATLPAALPGRHRGGDVELRLSTPAPGHEDEPLWVVELRRGGAPFAAVAVGATVDLPAGATATILAPYAGGGRLWLARLELSEPLAAYLARHGEPIRYRYVRGRPPLAAYQNAYALEPGSAEMPSAGRPLTAAVIARLAARGVLVAPVSLHTGVSSPERGEPPYPERFRVPAETARLANAVHGWGGRVVAVGTTVVRALESAAGADGAVAAGGGWTNLVVTPERGVRAVDGLVTGWHEPEASHLDLLRAVAGDDLLRRSYAAAGEAGYLWHEFGDSHLILP
jgi:S-adenosylmethionine:tRNA ribosyltransferase-isomerase